MQCPNPVPTNNTGDRVSFHFLNDKHTDSLIVTVRNAKNILRPRRRVAINYQGRVRFDPQAPTKFIIPGWRKDAKSRMNDLISMTYLDKYEKINLFNVDWSQESMTLNYVQSCLKIQAVARAVSDFIVTLMANGLSPDNISIIGHSLGAHIAGVVGKHLDGHLNSIVGLDPAGPLFFFLPENTRLSPSDAKYVEVIHTNGQYLGWVARLGHVDFYPNGGKRQPNCFLDYVSGCSHARASDLFAESLVTSKGFWGRKCNNTLKEVTSSRCRNDENIQMVMGGDLDRKLKFPGIYYLKTNGDTPFALGRLNVDY